MHNLHFFHRILLTSEAKIQEAHPGLGPNILKARASTIQRPSLPWRLPVVKIKPFSLKFEARLANTHSTNEPVNQKYLTIRR